MTFFDFQGKNGKSAEKIQLVVLALFCCGIYGDMVTTYLALLNGAFESNAGLHPYINPVFLLSKAPYIWYLLMIGFMAFAVGLSRSLSRYYRSIIGLCVLAVPIYMEWNAVIINIQNIL